MLDDYERISDDYKHSDIAQLWATVGRLGHLSLQLTYCTLSPSFWSSLSLLMSLMCFSIWLGVPSKPNLEIGGYLLYSLTTAAFTLFKGLAYGFGLFGEMSQDWIQFWELSNLLTVYLPLLLALTSAIVAIVLRQNIVVQKINTLSTISRMFFYAVSAISFVLTLTMELTSINLVGLVFVGLGLAYFSKKILIANSVYQTNVLWLSVILTIIFIAGNFLALSPPLAHINPKLGLSSFQQISTLDSLISSISLCLLFICNLILLRISKYKIQMELVLPSVNTSIPNEDHYRKSICEQLQMSPLKSKSKHVNQGPAELPFPLESPTRVRDIDELPPVFPSKKHRHSKKPRQKASFLKRVLHLLLSPECLLFLSQILLVISVQRYNSMLSLVGIVWLAFATIASDIKRSAWLAYRFLIPIAGLSFFLVYFSSVFQNLPSEWMQTIGFQQMRVPWLDLLICNAYILGLLAFTAVTQRARPVNSKRLNPTPQKYQVVLAVIFRYSYMMPVIALLLLAFSSVTLINLIYLVLFLVFFCFSNYLLTDGHSSTTFDRKYWFVIVGFTMACITAKYVYFLFFPDSLSELLEPTGINEIYSWSFNFSLSSRCDSNTTPYFILLMLSQLQSFVYHSQIYATYSFTLFRLLASKSGEKSRSFRAFGSLVDSFLVVYNKTLYPLSAIIILICSSRWNMFSLCIITLVSLSILTNFNRPILCAVTFIDLSYIFCNYCVLFLQYSVVERVLGESIYSFVYRLAQLLGLTLQEDGPVYQIFTLSIVIFYFSVECFRHATNLLTQLSPQAQFSEDSSFQSRSDRTSFISLQSDIHGYSTLGQSVIESNLIDEEFANNFQAGEIRMTHHYHRTDVFKYFTWLQVGCEWTYPIFPQVVAILAMFSCIFFRLSFSMLVFLMLYLSETQLFSRVCGAIKDVGYRARVDYWGKHLSQCSENLLGSNEKLFKDSEPLEETTEFISGTNQMLEAIKAQWRERIWILSTTLSLGCLILTYSAQFLRSDFYSTYLDGPTTIYLRQGLFVLGFSVEPNLSLFRQIYFYFFMVIINLIDKFLIYFNDYKTHQKSSFENLAHSSSPLSSPLSVQSLQADHSTPAYISVSISNSFNLSSALQAPPLTQSCANYRQRESSIVGICNSLIFNQVRMTVVQLSVSRGFIQALVRSCLWLLLLNVHQKSNLAAIAYLIALLVFWFRDMDFSLLKGINRVAAIILCAQYAIILCDITSQSSPLPIPQSNSLSLLRLFTRDEDLISFLIPGRSEQNLFIAFVISASIIVLTKVCLNLFLWLSVRNVKLVESLSKHYQHYFETLTDAQLAGTKVYINQSHFRGASVSFSRSGLNFLLAHSYILVSLAVFLLLWSLKNYISFVLLVLAFAFLYLGIISPLSDHKRLYSFTHGYFAFLQGMLLLIVCFSALFNVPFLPGSFKATAKQIGAISPNFTIVLMILLLRLWLDLYRTEQFARSTRAYLKEARRRAGVMVKCLAYQSNHQTIQDVAARYKEILRSELTVTQAFNTINRWQNKLHRPQDQLELGPNSTQLTVIENKQFAQIRAEMDEELKRRPEEDTKLLQQIRAFIETHSDVAVTFEYSKLFQFIIHSNCSFLTTSQKALPLRDYIVEDYDRLDLILQEADRNLDRLADELIGCNELQAKIERLSQVESKFTDSECKLQIPDCLELDSQGIHHPFWLAFMQFVLSNFTSVLYLFVALYYVINPCLLSLPPVVYCYSYAIVSNKSHSAALLIYLFVVVAMIETVSLMSYKGFWVQFLFPHTNSGWSTAAYDTDEQTSPSIMTFEDSASYLYFLFVLIFANESIAKYRGTKFGHYSLKENLQRAVIRVLNVTAIHESRLSESNQCVNKSQLPINAPNNTLSSKEGSSIPKSESQKAPEQFGKKQESSKSIFKQQSVSSKEVTEMQQENQKTLSSLNLWRYSGQEHRQLDCNPFVWLLNKFTVRGPSTKQQSLLDFIREPKTGIDLYPWIASVQIFITIYLLFLYPLLVQGSLIQIEETFTYFQFSSGMVISVLIQVVLIVIERRITLMETELKPVLKYVYTMLVLSLVIWFIYFYAPLANSREYQPNSWLVAFGCLYWIYFTLSGLQIRIGYKRYKAINSMMKRRRTFNNIAVACFKAIPFLLELKCLMDWSFLPTSLSLFDWFKLFSIYYSAFKAKISYFSVTAITLGRPKGFAEKLIGWVGFILVLGIIFGPMVLFSGLNPIAQTNLVVKGALQVGIRIVNGDYFSLYSTSHFNVPPKPMTEAYFDSLGLDSVPILETLSASSIPQQMQTISFQPFSDQNWAISTPSYQKLLRAIQATLVAVKQGFQPPHSFQLVTRYLLTRQVQSIGPSDSTFSYPANNGNLSYLQLKSMNQTLSICNTSTVLPQFFNSLIRLMTVNNAYKTQPIRFATPNNTKPYVSNLNLTLYCSSGVNTSDTSNTYWELEGSSENQQVNGLKIYVYCDKYQRLIAGLGFTALYTSVILLVANFLRSMFSSNLPEFTYYLNPNPDSILTICEAIGTLRTRKQYREEYLLFYELIDIIRSPEIIRHMSGSYSAHIKAKSKSE